MSEDEVAGEDEVEGEVETEGEGAGMIEEGVKGSGVDDV